MRNAPEHRSEAMMTFYTYPELTPKYLARISGKPGVLPGLIKRGGLRARILDEGVIRIDDFVQPV